MDCKRIKKEGCQIPYNNLNVTTIYDLPSDVMNSIFFLFEPDDWSNVLLTCKLFYHFGMRSFNYCLNNNYIIKYACAVGQYEFVRKLLDFDNKTLELNNTSFDRVDNNNFSMLQRRKN